MSDLIPFEFEANNVRIILDENNNPWFVLKDVCSILGLTNPTVVAQTLDDDERSKSKLGRQGQATVINESGLYAVIMRSRKPSAKRFRKWVTSEVLPSIRKTGQYQSQPQINMVAPTGDMLVQMALAYCEHERRLSEIESRQRDVELNSLKRDRKLARDQARLEHKFQAIETAIEYFTIIGWWSLTYQESLPTETAAQYGRIAAKYCRKHGYEIGKTTDSRYGRSIPIRKRY